MEQQEQEPGRRSGLPEGRVCAVKKLRKIGKVLLVIVLVLAFVYGVASLILGRRFAAAIEKVKAAGDPVSVATLGGEPVPDAENAAIIYEKVFKRLGSANGKKQLNVLDCVPAKDGASNVWTGTGDASTSGFSKEVMDSPTFWSDAKKAGAYFSDVLPMVEQAVARPKCKFDTRWQDGFGALFPQYGRLRQLDRLLCAQAILLARDGKTDEAYQTLELAFKVAKTTCNDPILIAVLVKCALNRMANEALLDVMKYGAPNARQAEALNSMLDTTDYGPDFASAMKGERAAGLWAYDYVRATGTTDAVNATTGSGSASPSRWVGKLLRFGWRPILYADGVVYLDYMNKQVEAASLPYRSGKQKQIDQSFGRLPRYAILARIILPVFTRARLSVDAARAETALAQVVLAAQQYKAQTGAYPASLEELSAKMGRNLPEDPFSGKDLVYKRDGKGFQVYSISGNLRDDGGVPRKEHGERDSGDMVVFWTH